MIRTASLWHRHSCLRWVLIFSGFSLLAQEPRQTSWPRARRRHATVYRPFEKLCDGIGGRPTGSVACDRAIVWAAEEVPRHRNPKRER